MVKIVLPKSRSAELAEETGAHIGDGSMNIYGNGGMVSIGGHPNDDREYYEGRLVPLYERLYGITPRLRHWSGVYGFQVCSSELVRFKNKLGLPLGPKTFVRIPAWIRNGDAAVRAACLRGIFDTDGVFYVERKNDRSYPHIRITTVSRRLARDVERAMAGFDLHGGVWAYVPKTPNWSTTYVVGIRGDEQVNRWMKAVGTSNPKHLGKYLRWKEGSIKNKRDKK